MQNTKHITKYIFLLILIIILTIPFVLCRNITIMIFLLCLIGFISMSTVRFELSHPYVWFIPFLLLYSISAPILFLAGKHIIYMEATNLFVAENNIVQILLMAWIALSTYILVISPKKVSFSRVKFNFKNDSPLLKTLLLISVLAIVLMCFYAVLSGVGSKREFLRHPSILHGFGGYGISFMFFPLTFFTLKYSQVKKRINIKAAIFFLLLGLLVVFTVGERDVLLRIILSYIFIYHIFVKKINIIKLSILGISVLFSLAFLQNMKGIFLADPSASFIEHKSLLDSIFGGEFYYHSVILVILMTYGLSGSFSFLDTLLTDIKFAIFKIPFLGPLVVDNNIESAATWFAKEFFAKAYELGIGRAFSLIGEGYLILGYLGIFFIYFLLALIIRMLYQKSKCTVCWLVTYIVMIPTAIVCIRLDFANYLFLLVRYCGIPMFYVIISKKIFLHSRRIVKHG